MASLTPKAFADLCRRKMVKEYGSIKAGAEKLGCSYAYLRNFISSEGTTQPPKAILNYMGAEKVKKCEKFFIVNDKKETKR